MIKIAIVACVGIAGAALLAYFLMRNTPNRIYVRAGSLHRQGEICYRGNENELAEEYYSEAEKLRQKARTIAAKRNKK